MTVDPERDSKGRYIPKGFRPKEVTEEVQVKDCKHEKPDYWPFTLCADCIRKGPIHVVQ